MLTLRSSEPPVAVREDPGLRCEGTVLVHHDLTTTCTAAHCVAPAGSDAWAMAHTKFHGCDYVLRRCPDCAVELAAPPWTITSEDRAA